MRTRRGRRIPSPFCLLTRTGLVPGAATLHAPAAVPLLLDKVVRAVSGCQISGYGVLDRG